MGRWIVIVALLATARPVFADDPEALTTQGEALAKSGEFSRAIELFKRADAIAPSAKHACLIGLVYTRRELWSQAEIFLDRCKQRASASDPLPDWFAEATAQLAQKLSGVDVAEVAIEVEPPSVANVAVVSVSTFPPDETFEPRTIHLVPGIYVISASAPGYRSSSETVTAKLGASTVVKLKLAELPHARPTQRTESGGDHRALARDLLIGAAAVAVVGIGFHIIASLERSDLETAATNNDPMDWSAHSNAFEASRGAAIGCYSVAVIAAAVGVVLHVQHHDSAPILTGSVGPGSAIVGLELRR